MSPAEINEKLLSLLNELGRLNEEYEKQYLTYINYYNKYKLEYAKSYLLKKASFPKATVGEIESYVMVDIAELKLQSDIAEGILKGTKEKMEAVKIEIDTLRSVLSFQKSELDRTMN